MMTPSTSVLRVFEDLRLHPVWGGRDTRWLVQSSSWYSETGCWDAGTPEDQTH